MSLQHSTGFSADCAGYRGIVIAAAIVMTLSLFSAGTVNAETPQSLSVPAQCAFELSMPGTVDNLLRPSRVLVDNRTDEIYVADPGHSRIVIFDSHGIVKFQFSVIEHFGAPTDIAVSSEGYIFVLGTTREGKRVKVFDFDGMYLRDFSGDLDDPSMKITSIAMDESDRLFLVDESGIQVLCYSMAGKKISSFPLVPDLDEKLRRESVPGSISIHNDEVYVPIPSLGSVYVYDVEGERVRSIGHKGSTLGELNFPISAAVSNDQIVFVLDKHRHNVVCYDINGKFLGEFGGKGVHKGWFYHPTWIAVDSSDQVYVGQVFQSRIQVCTLPEFIIERNNDVQASQIDSEEIEENLIDNTTQADRRWSLANSQSTSQYNHRSDDTERVSTEIQGTNEDSQ